MTSPLFAHQKVSIKFLSKHKRGNKNAVGNKGWMKGGVTAKYVASKLGDEVEIPEELK